MISVRPVTEENWQEVLKLRVRADQLPFAGHFEPIAAEALAKAYVRPGGLVYEPYAICQEEEAIGFFLLSHPTENSSGIGITFFFIDREHQGQGYGSDAIEAIAALVREMHPTARTLNLTIHPENEAGFHFYTACGFSPTEETWRGYPVWKKALSESL